MLRTRTPCQAKLKVSYLTVRRSYSNYLVGVSETFAVLSVDFFRFSASISFRTSINKHNFIFFQCWVTELFKCLNYMNFFKLFLFRFNYINHFPFFSLIKRNHNMLDSFRAASRFHETVSARFTLCFLRNKMNLINR